MAFNLTGIDEDLYFAANSAANIAIFSTLILPPLVLCLLCVLALVMATDVSMKIRVLLLNVFAAEICSWLAYVIFFLGFPSRIVHQDGEYSCNVFLSLALVFANQKFTAGAFYAVMVYLFIKYGEKRLKWYVIVTVIVITWVVFTFGLGVLPYFSGYGVTNINGFCTSDSESSSFRASVAILFINAIVCMFITFTFCVLIFVYIKKNTLEDNVDIKKAVAKVLLYLSFSSALSFVNSVVPVANAPIRDALEGRNIIALVAVNYVLRLVFILPNIATPIVAIVLLRPIRVSLKQVFLKVCCACRKASPAPEN